MSAEELLAQDFGAFPDLIRAHARERPDHAALIEGDAILTYRELAALMDRIAFALQRDGVSAGEAVAICARASIPYAAAFCGVLAAGAVVSPLAPSSTAAGLVMMIEDCSAKILFLDRETGEALETVSGAGRATPVALDDSAAGKSLSRWLGPEGATPAAVGLAVQHHLLVGHHRRAQGDRSAPCDALAAAQPDVVQGRGDACLNPALFEHHPGRFHSDLGAWRNGRFVAEI